MAANVDAADHYVFSVIGCSSSGLKTYTVTVRDQFEFWRATNVADANDSEISWR